MAVRLAVLAICALLVPAVPVGARVSLVDVPLSGDPLELVLLDRSFDLTHDISRDRAGVLLHDDADRAALAALFPSREVVHDVLGAQRPMRAREQRAARAADDSALPSGRSSYRALPQYLADLDALAASKPGLARKVVLPVKSVEGRDIQGVELAGDVNRADDGRPVFLVFGLHHAREWPSGEVAIEFALDLAGRYGQPGQERWTALLDRLRVIVVPVVNPDGFVVSRGDVEAAPGGPDPMHRRNCRPVAAAEESQPCAQRSGVDLNRNYGAGWGGVGASSDPSSDSYRGPAPFSEPEARAVHELSRALAVTGVESIHNIAGQVLRQPGFQNYGPSAPDEPRMKEIGDRMAAATGYDSLYGYQLYDVHGATEDWNYIEQGAYGYTVELGPASAPVFQGPYGSHVVEQYTGGGGAGRGMREALLIEAEAAADPRDHSVLHGRAPSGALLRVHRDFTTDSVPVCADTSSCGSPGPVISLPDFAEATTTVGAGGAFSWHVGPSTRPWEGRAGRTETWTLSCEKPAGTVLATRKVALARGQSLAVDPCQSATPGGAVTAGSLTLSASLERARLQTLLRRGLRVRARCSKACTTTTVIRLGKRVVARWTLRLKPARSTRFSVRFGPSGARSVRRGRGKRLQVAVRAAAGGATVTKTLRLSLR